MGNGMITEELSIPFNILKPWYLSSTALGIYILIAIGLLYLLISKLATRFKALKNQVKRTETRSKAEIQRLETEKIQAELDHKKRELVSTTVHVAKKNETLQQLGIKLKELQGQIDNPKVSKQIQKIILSLRNEERTDDAWQQLMYHFNEIHPDFFEQLKINFPLLTPKDLKLAAYLKMNLSTKDMATLMNVSIRGVEASRYRLRKKMDIASDVNLNEFFMKY